MVYNSPPKNTHPVITAFSWLVIVLACGSIVGAVLFYVVLPLARMVIDGVDAALN